MGFLFTVMGLRAFGVAQRPFVGSVGVECEFWVCGLWDWISRFHIARDAIGCVFVFPICSSSHCSVRFQFLTLALCVVVDDVVVF